MRDAETLISEFDYRILWRSRESRTGLHRSATVGSGFEFSGYMPLTSADEAREVDLDATVRDPFQRLQIRVLKQKSAITVYCIADLSASLNFETKMRSLAVFAASLAYSAYRTRDAFGFIGCGEEVIEEFVLPPSRLKSTALELGSRLLEYTPISKSADGLRLAFEYLKRRRSLVFLASDFFIPLALVNEVLDSLASHQVVPIVIRDSSEFDEKRIPRFGIARLRDLESGKERFVMLSPHRQRMFKDEFNSRERELKALFESYGVEPFYLVDVFDAERMSEFFLS
jgi:uncharacterized protein (DUF58 family)